MKDSVRARLELGPENAAEKGISALAQVTAAPALAIEYNQRCVKSIHFADGLQMRETKLCLPKKKGYTVMYSELPRGGSTCRVVVDACLMSLIKLHASESKVSSPTKSERMGSSHQLAFTRAALSPHQCVFE